MNTSVWQRTTNLFRTEYHNLVRFVRNMIDDAAERDSEDIVQEVALHILEHTDMTMPIEHLTSYVYQALRNKVIDYFRKKKKTISLSTSIGNEDEEITLENIIEDESEDLGKFIENKQLADKVLAIIQKIEIRQAAVFLATEIDGYSFRELSDDWSVPIGTLLSLKSRAVKKIREKLTTLIDTTEIKQGVNYEAARD